MTGTTTWETIGLIGSDLLFHALLKLKSIDIYSRKSSWHLLKNFLLVVLEVILWPLELEASLIDISTIKNFSSFSFDPQLSFFLSLNLLFIGLKCTNADQKLQSQSSPDLLSPGSMFFSLMVPNKGSKFSLACDVFCGKESLFCVPLYVSSFQINFRKHKNASWAKAY